jgi:Fe-Mn family superoxide dismutase
MKKKKLVEINDNELKSIISNSLKKTGALVSEALVAEPKSFKLVTDSLSQRTKDAHNDLYVNYVESFNKISAKLDGVDHSKSNSNHSDFRSLKLDEAYSLNAKWLHELYFANTFSPTSEIYADSLTYIRLSSEFGNFENWQDDFISCCKSCGEGWAICGVNLHTKRYTNTMISHHSGDVMVGIYPIIVIDMWAHSYYKDYINDKENYIVDMMKELNWPVIENRINKAEKLLEVLK